MNTLDTHSIILESKFCKKCKLSKKVAEFGKDSGSKDGLHFYCKSCNILQSKGPNKDYAKNRHLLRSYGVTMDQYNEMFSKQDGKCAICRTHQSELKRALSVDHSHSTGKVRGLLCGGCNQGIGHLKENCEILKAASEYLLNFENN